MATEPKKWHVAPGANADCNDIPDTADADSGLASWSALFPQLTALPLSAGGRAPKREDFNGLLRAFGLWVFYFMQGGVPSWEESIAYTAGSFARHGGTTWTALKDSTGEEPAEGEYWHALSNFYTSGSLVSDLLNRVDGGVLVGILLLDFLVIGLDQAQDPVIGGVCLAGQRADIPLGDVLLGNLKCTVGHDGLFHQVLDLFHRGAAAHFLAGNADTFRNAGDLQRGHANLLISCIVGLGDGHYDLMNVKYGFSAVSLNDFHIGSSFATTGISCSVQDSLYYILWFCQA